MIYIYIYDVFKPNCKLNTYLQRIGPWALETPEKLCDLLGCIQDESVPIEDRVQSGLVGEYKVNGVGKAILTGFLHTIYPEKYGVWNGSTEQAFKKLGIYAPFTSKKVGETYSDINNALHMMASKVNYSLTYVDGFMWYVATKLSSSLK